MFRQLIFGVEILVGLDFEAHWMLKICIAIESILLVGY